MIKIFAHPTTLMTRGAVRLVCRTENDRRSTDSDLPRSFRRGGSISAGEVRGEVGVGGV